MFGPPLIKNVSSFYQEIETTVNHQRVARVEIPFDKAAPF